MGIGDFRASERTAIISQICLYHKARILDAPCYVKFDGFAKTALKVRFQEF